MVELSKPILLVVPSEKARETSLELLKSKIADRQNFDSHTWLFDTKYYHASVKFVVYNPSEPLDSLAAVEAVIYLY